jgi:phenylalanyl-tRNA synthetase beta chain
LLVSVNWLCELCPVEAGPNDIARALTDRGLTVDAIDHEVVPGDVVLDLDIPANRPDCLGHIGIARELSAAFGTALSPAAEAGTSLEVSSDALDAMVKVEIEDPGSCSRYTARLVRNVTIGPSSKKVQDRLIACGLRPLNNVVDASNLVLLETGHPIHTFDYRLVQGGRIIVKNAAAGEKFTTLDQVERTLDGETLMITDPDHAIALAGIMGGAGSEIRDDTTDVLIEAAWFQPVVIRKAARKLGLHTDASHRFERGMDPNGVLAAQALATRYLEEMAGGVAVPGMIDCHPAPAASKELELRYSQVERLLGYDPGSEEISSALDALQLNPEKVKNDRVRITVPSWRVDLEYEADLVEEVARHLGLDRLHNSLPGTIAPTEEETVHPLAERTRDIFAGLGFQEAFCYSMIPPGADDSWVPVGTWPAVELDNPIAEQLTILRRSILPGLLQSVDRNLRRGNRDIRLFEVGRVFLPGPKVGDRPDEPLRAAVAWSGLAAPRHWSREPLPADLGDMSGAVRSSLEHLRPGIALRTSRSELPGFHNGQAVCWKTSEGTLLAWAGRLHPDLMARFDLPQDVYLAEIDLDAIRDSQATGFNYRPIPKVPTVSRDLSIVLGSDASFQDLLDLLESRPSPAPATFQAVDSYSGSGLDAGESALTVRVILVPHDRTLTDEETEQYRLDLIRTLESSELPVKLRG